MNGVDLPDIAAAPIYLFWALVLGAYVTASHRRFLRSYADVKGYQMFTAGVRWGEWLSTMAMLAGSAILYPLMALAVVASIQQSIPPPPWMWGTLALLGGLPSVCRLLLKRRLERKRRRAALDRQHDRIRDHRRGIKACIRRMQAGDREAVARFHQHYSGNPRELLYDSAD